jgi:hypothetical protein
MEKTVTEYMRELKELGEDQEIVAIRGAEYLRQVMFAERVESSLERLKRLKMKPNLCEKAFQLSLSETGTKRSFEYEMERILERRFPASQPAPAAWSKPFHYIFEGLRMLFNLAYRRFFVGSVKATGTDGCSEDGKCPSAASGSIDNGTDRNNESNG